jgi:membrane protease YdiL (CAAX protease family)
VIILSNFYLFKSSTRGALKQLDSALKKSRAPMMESQNTIIMLAQLFFAVYSFNWIYYYILQLGQVPTHTPDFSALSDWALIYNLTSAAVYEEIISRILLIGIPLLIIHAILKRLKKPMKNYILGGDFEINKITIILIIFSSITFGLAHAPGWDYWKVIPTFISGFALGYLYIRKGIFAAILLHFTINFLSIPLLLLNYSIFVSLLYFFAILFFIFMGIIYIGYYITRIFKLFKKKKATLTV